MLANALHPSRALKVQSSLLASLRDASLRETSTLFHPGAAMASPSGPWLPSMIPSGSKASGRNCLGLRSIFAHRILASGNALFTPSSIGILSVSAFKPATKTRRTQRTGIITER